MVKGVNRKIIEITDMSSDYYERALLIVKPEFSDLSKSQLEREAREVLKDIGFKFNKRNKFGGMSILRWGIATVLFSFLIMTVCFVLKII